MASFESFAITPGQPATLAAYVTKITEQITAGATQSKALAAGYDPVPAYRRPVWTIAAFVRQGRIYEILARAVLNTPFIIPADQLNPGTDRAFDTRVIRLPQCRDRYRPARVVDLHRFQRRLFREGLDHRLHQAMRSVRGRSVRRRIGLRSSSRRMLVWIHRDSA